MFDDINFLVQETFKNVENKGFLGSLLAKDENLPEEVPGIFYHLQKKASTFVIRIHPSENLKEDYKNILKHPDMYPTLRLNESEEEVSANLQFFECDRFEVAKAIKRQLGNKRFPIHEERVFNVSDPGDSWWLKLEDTRVSIFFKLSHTEDMSRLVKLGPLGDPQDTMEIFSQLGGYFKMIFPLSDYSSAHGTTTIACADPENQNFQFFKTLLKNGETSYDFWEYLRRLEQESQDRPFIESLQKANYFLMELSCLREFWKEIQIKL